MHDHYYKVMPGSTFGVKRVHALLRCEGTEDGKPCRDNLVKTLAYTDCDSVTTKAGRTTYYWPKKAIYRR
jgi:hypothetical protein